MPLHEGEATSLVCDDEEFGEAKERITSVSLDLVKESAGYQKASAARGRSPPMRTRRCCRFCLRCCSLLAVLVGVIIILCLLPGHLWVSGLHALAGSSAAGLPSVRDPIHPRNVSAVVDWQAEKQSLKAWATPGESTAAQAAYEQFPDNPLMQNLEDPDVSARIQGWLDAANLRQGAPVLFDCGELQDIVREVGVNGAYMLVPMGLWHQLSQVIGERMAQVGADIPTTLQAIAFLVKKARLQLQSGNTGGFMHGAVWYLLGSAESRTGYQLDINDQSLSLKERNIYLHGYGHGVLIAQAHGPDYNMCSPHPPGTMDHLHAAVRQCLDSGETAFTQCWCTAGVYHAMTEYVDVEVRPDDLLHPCTTSPLSAWCFQWMFLYVVGGAAQLRSQYAAWLSFPDHVAELCAGPSLAGESQVNGCIWGMSWTLYIFFHEMWLAERNHEPLTPLEVCLQVPSVLTSEATLQCPGLVNRSTPLVRQSGSASSLVDWCALFVHGPIVDAVGMRRWHTCLEGASGTILFFMVKGVVPVSSWLDFCRHDLPWQNSAEWRAMEAKCLSILPAMMITQEVQMPYPEMQSNNDV